MRKLLWMVFVTVALMMMATSAFAYRLILIPVGEVLPPETYKLELSGPICEALDEWLPAWRFDGTICKGLEIGLKASGPPGTMRVSTTVATVTYQLAGETADAPGVGLGVMNLFDSNPDRDNSFFIGIWKSVKTPISKYPLKFHLVQGWKYCEGTQGGVIIPLSKRFSAAVEYLPENMFLPGQENHIVWALGYNQTKNWRFKYANVDGDSAYGVVYTNKWLTK